MRKKNTEPLDPDTYYHVYNRGINGTRLFTKTGNTDYFLAKYLKNILPIADTYAYVLMGNHFHFLIKTKSEAEILEFYRNRQVVENDGRAAFVNSGRAISPPRVINDPPKVDNTDTNTDDTDNKKEKTATQIISQQFSNLFNAYAQAINKQDKRTGGLFEDPFRRIPIDSLDYLAHMVYYIHNNPVKHGFDKDFTSYPYSSYPTFLNEEETFIQREEVFSWFGGKEPFLIYHGQKHDFDEDWYKKNWVEKD